jgi:hypothetical protein
MRILVTGDRFWVCRDLATDILRRLIERYGHDVVIVHSGGCGVDQSFEVACRDLGINVESHPVNHEWVRLGKMERPARNAKMVAAGADLCIAIHRDISASTGTKDCARQAIEAGIPTYVVESEKGRPERLRADDARLR